MPMILNAAFAEYDADAKLEIHSDEINLIFPGFKNASFYISRPTDDDPKWNGTFEFFSGSWPAHEYLEANTLYGLLGLARTKWDDEIKGKIDAALEKYTSDDTTRKIECEAALLERRNEQFEVMKIRGDG